MSDIKVSKPKNNTTNNKGSIDGVVNTRVGSMKNNRFDGGKSDKSSDILDENQSVQPNQQKGASNRKVNNITAITLALVILIGLSGVAIFAYIQNRSNPSTAANGQTAQTPQIETATSASNDVDQIIGEIDRLTDERDTSGDGLTDQNLGL